MGQKGGIIGSLVFAVAFAAALVGYIYRSIPSREELLAGNSMSPATSAGFAHAEALDARAKASASAFVASLAAGNDQDAFALMAEPFRAGTDAAAFARTCRSSPFLSKAESVALYTVRETFAPGARSGAISATGVLTTAAGAVPVRFSFLAERERLAILSVVVADAPVLTAAAPAARPSG